MSYYQRMLGEQLLQLLNIRENPICPENSFEWHHGKRTSAFVHISSKLGLQYAETQKNGESEIAIAWHSEWAALCTHSSKESGVSVTNPSHSYRYHFHPVDQEISTACKCHYTPRRGFIAYLCEYQELRDARTA